MSSQRLHSSLNLRSLKTPKSVGVNVAMGIASTVPITRITGALAGVGFEGLKAVNDQTNSFGEASATAAGVHAGKAFFQAASKDAIVGENQSLMKAAKGGIGKIGAGLGAISIVKELSSDATPQEIIEGFTFQVAVKGKIGNLNIANEGVLEFNNDELSVGQAANTLNTIFSTVSEALSGFDLTNKSSIKDANKFLRSNLGSIIKEVNRLLRAENKDGK